MTRWTRDWYKSYVKCKQPLILMCLHTHTHIQTHTISNNHLLELFPSSFKINHLLKSDQSWHTCHQHMWISYPGYVCWGMFDDPVGSLYSKDVELVLRLPLDSAAGAAAVYCYWSHFQPHSLFLLPSCMKKVTWGHNQYSESPAT